MKVKKSVCLSAPTLRMSQVNAPLASSTTSAVLTIVDVYVNVEGNDRDKCRSWLPWIYKNPDEVCVVEDGRCEVNWPAAL